MLAKSLQEGSGNYNKTIKYLKEERKFSGDQLKRIIEDKSEFYAYFLEGAWGNKIELQPRGIAAKAIVALRKFLAEIKGAFAGMEFTNVHQLVAVVQAGQLARDGIIIPGKTLADTKAGPQIKKFTSEVPEGQFKEDLEKGVMIDLIKFSEKPDLGFDTKAEAGIKESNAMESIINESPEMNAKKQAFEDLVYQDRDKVKTLSIIGKKGNDLFKKSNPVLFRINKHLNQNAVLLSRKYSMVGNIHNFQDKLNRKVAVVKNAFSKDLEVIMNNFNPEELNLMFTDALTDFQAPKTNEAGIINPVSKVLNNAYEFIQNGKKLESNKVRFGEAEKLTNIEKDFYKIINSIKSGLKEGKPLSIPHKFQTDILQLATKVIWNKYSDYTKFALHNGNQITFGNPRPELGDYDLPPASLNRDKNYLLDAPENMRSLLKQYNEDMVPSSMGGTFKPFEYLSPTMTAVLKLSYPLQLAFKISSIPVNVLGGITGAFAAAQRHGGGIGSILGVLSAYATVGLDKSLWLGGENTGRFAKQINRSRKEAVVAGDPQTWEGSSMASARAFGGQKGSKIANMANNAVKKSMIFTNKANEHQRTAAMYYGLILAEKKGITDANLQYDFAVNFVNESAGDFRTFARRESAKPLMRLINMFKSEPQFLAQNLIALGRENPKALAGTLAYLITTAGAVGIPYAEDFFDLLDIVIAPFNGGEVGNFRKYLANALGNMSGDKEFGKQFVYGYMAPNARIAFSLRGATSAAGIPSMIKEIAKGDTVSGFSQAIPALGIVAQQASNLLTGTKKQSGLPGRVQAGYKLATESGDFEKWFYKLLGLSTQSADKYYKNSMYFNN